MIELKEKIRKILQDWKCFTWHSPNEEDVIIDDILEAAICDNCDLKNDGVCIEERGGI